MKQSIRVSIAIVMVGVVAVLCAWQLRSRQNAKMREAQEVQAVVPINFESLRLSPQKVSYGFSVQGVTQPFQEVVIASEATGKISKLYFNQGDVVPAGAALCTVDASLREIELNSASVQYKKAKSDYERYLQLQSANNMATADVENAHLQMMHWQYQLQALNQQLKESTVYAPFRGIIAEKLVDVGGYLQYGTPVATLINIERMKAFVWVDEKAVASLSANDSVRIHLDAKPEVVIHGTVGFVSPKSNESGKFQVSVEFGNTIEARAGMTLRAFFHEDDTAEVLMIPKSALVLSSSAPAVYVLEGSKARLQPVVLGNSRENQVEITEGIAANTVIVAKGVENVIDGMTLTISEAIQRK